MEKIKELLRVKYAVRSELENRIIMNSRKGKDIDKIDLDNNRVTNAIISTLEGLLEQ